MDFMRFFSMSELRILSIPEQIASYLRSELASGRWSGTLPGRFELAALLGVGITSMEQALRQLEREGALVRQGVGRRRGPAVAMDRSARPMRLAILEFEPPAVALSEGYMMDLMHRLGEAGHRVFFAEKCLLELGMNVQRVARMVRKTEADAWIVVSASHEVLEWFAEQPRPVFALFGRRHTLPIAGVGPDHVSARAAVARRLIELGHRRIVQIVRRSLRLPVPGASERAMLDEMAANGIETSAFNLPDWEESVEGFHRCLRELFRYTPPTALVVGEPAFGIAALQFLGRLGMRVPEDVSLVFSDPNPVFDWCEPMIAHIRWNRRPVVNRVVRWAANVSRGKNDRRQTLTPAEFVEGGTVGVAK